MKSQANAGVIAIVFSLFTILLIIIMLMIVYRIWSKTRGLNGDGNPTLAEALEGLRLYGKTQVRIVFNGREYSSVQEMHPNDRRAYEQVMGKLSGGDITQMITTSSSDDRDRNKPAQTDSIPPPGEGPVETLRKLKDMKYAGLITEDDYDAKKAEILARM